MPRARTKDDLLELAAENYAKLMDMISNMTETQLNTPFDFSGDANKKEAHWSRDKNVRDVLIHLYEWHCLMLKFIENNAHADGKNAVPFLPAEYSWKTYGAMNVMFWKRHQNTSLETAKEMLSDSHKKVLALAEKYSNEELFTKKYFPWTGTTDLGSYFVSTTASHYDWAIKKIKAHIRVLDKASGQHI